MKINITKKQYRQLIEMCEIACNIMGSLGDQMNDEQNNYKEKYREYENIEKYLLQFAPEMESKDLVEKYEEKLILSDKYYEDEIIPITEDYEDLILHDSLANKLAWRDFLNEHSKEEIEKMAENNNGYFGVEIFDYEKRYWDEFEEHEFDRLKIVGNNVFDPPTVTQSACNRECKHNHKSQ